MQMSFGKARVWEETVTIPTYGVGAPNKNPMFLEKRVYQGSSGRVYPHPVTDKIFDEKADKAYRAIFLENDFIRVMLLPEIGGRIQRAYDKVGGQAFVYYNHVIKPALVGLAGPWISGGIEFNWPQHHRPSTFDPVDYTCFENADGSATAVMGEIEAMFRTKSTVRFTLYPDRAYIEISAQLYNRTPVPQTFLWWANPAVAVNDNTRTIFPPDVTAVMDHGKRAVSTFPIATGTYYKVDYSAGVDISRYKNLPVPTSYMAAKSDYDFVGGYDDGTNEGVLHVADHHVAPGKKQWTWGCGDFGKAWDRNLTDSDGPYVELMTGCFTDNQPDFSWLMPQEEKRFTQYFMPYRVIGTVHNATKDLAMNFEDGAVHLYASGNLGELAVVALAGDTEVLHETCTQLCPDFPTAYRNLALACYNKRADASAARAALEKAFALDTSDARVLFELDCLYQKIGETPQARLLFLEQHLPLVQERDDLYTAYITLLNQTGRCDDALECLQTHRFHPWEGGEGKAPAQYVAALCRKAAESLKAGDAKAAIECLEHTFTYPENLGEGKLCGAQENLQNYLLGEAYSLLGEKAKAESYYKKASAGLSVPQSAVYYNDQPPESIFCQGLALRRLGAETDACTRFQSLTDFADAHENDEVQIDYFAVSLPDFLVFDADLHLQNRVHCLFMRGLGQLGLGKRENAMQSFSAARALDNSHAGLTLYTDLFAKGDFVYATIESGFTMGDRREGTSTAVVNDGFFEVFKANGGTHMFAGHDHNNNFITEYEGVTLGYMTKSSYNCYFDFDALGGTVLTIDAENNVTTEIVPF